MLERPMPIDRAAPTRRIGVGGKHPSTRWTRDTVVRAGPKSPRVGYAPPESRTKPWPLEARIAGWFPHLRENTKASMSAG